MKKMMANEMCMCVDMMMWLEDCRVMPCYVFRM